MAFQLNSTKVLRYCWHTLAGVLVLLALLMSLFRALLPELDQVKQQLVDYIEQQHHLKIEVGELQAQWRGFGPALTLSHLALPKQPQLPLSLSIDELQIDLDFWQSVLTLSPKVDTVVFSGLDVKLDLDKLRQNSLGSNADTSWLYALLLEQLAHFSITDASLSLISVKHQLPPILIRDLIWRNRGGQHLAKGLVYLDENSSLAESLSLNVALKGDGYQPESIVGEIYLLASDLNIGHWASRQPSPFDQQQKMQLQGVVNLEAWMSVANRSIDTATVRFKPSWLSWPLNEQTQELSLNQGHISWHTTNDGWLLNSELALASNGIPWPEIQILSHNKQGDVSASLNQLDLSLLQPLLPLLPEVNKPQLDSWQLLQPQGKVSNLSFHQTATQPWQLSVNVKDLSWQAASPIPGAAAMDLDLSIQQDKISVSAPAQAYSFDFQAMFDAPLSFHGAPFQANVDLQAQSLKVKKLQLSNADLTLDSALALDFSHEMQLGLLAKLKIKDVAAVHHYLPRSLMDKSLVDYLNSALQAGEINDGTLVWQGALQDFPYQDHSGIFQAGFTLDKARFQFQPDWPSIAQLSLNAFFENKSMDLWVKQGQLLSVSAQGTHVQIKDLTHSPLLSIQTSLATTMRNAEQVIQASPLNTSVGNTLKLLQLKGEISTDLDLSIPLSEQGAKISGTVGFKDNPLYINGPNIELDDLNGEIQFENNVVTGKDLSASLYDQPLNFSFYTGQHNKDYAVNIELNGHWQLGSLPEVLDNPLSDHYQGELDWNGELVIVTDDQGYRLQGGLYSDLAGTELLLPGEFAKTKQAQRPLSAEIIGDNKQMSLGITLGDIAEFWGAFDLDNRTGSTFAYYDLLLGRLYRSGDRLEKNQGHLQLALTSADFMQWEPIINSFIDANSKLSTTAATDKHKHKPAAAQTSAKQSLFPPLALITGHIDELKVMGQELENVDFSSSATLDAWRLQADSKQFKGYIDFYPDWQQQGLKIVADKLYLQKRIKPDPEHAQDLGNESQPADSPPATPMALPPLAITASDFRVNEKPLGKLELTASPSSNSYDIQNLSLTTDDIKLQGQGRWQHQQQALSHSYFSFNLKADKFDALSELWGIDPGLKDAPLSLQADVNWSGAPADFALAKLNGQVEFKLGEGHLSEVSDKGARILSLFSLDSILKKLTLDFSDVFGKGLYFDSFKGNLKIEHGVVSTTNTKMKAIVGDMKVRGYTNLVNEALHYEISFVPKIASSVPTVVLLTTGGWTLGLGAFVLTKVLEPIIEVISELRFSVTGTMSKPILKELSRKSKAIHIPESVLPHNQEDKPSPAADQTEPQDKGHDTETSTETGTETKPQPSTQDQTQSP